MIMNHLKLNQIFAILVGDLFIKDFIVRNALLIIILKILTLKYVAFVRLNIAINAMMN